MDDIIFWPYGTVSRAVWPHSQTIKLGSFTNLHALIEKNRRKLKFQWIFTSMIYDFHSTPSVSIHWNFDFRRLFSNSVLGNKLKVFEPIKKYCTQCTVLCCAVLYCTVKTIRRLVRSSFPSHTCLLLQLAKFPGTENMGSMMFYNPVITT